jgi:DNA mismatch endonuclease (patch repair protein)
LIRRMNRTASFRTLRPTTLSAARVGRANRRSGTQPERALRAALRRLGLRHRSNDRKLPGCPDIVFVKEKLTVFCDGDFWHGRNWSRRRAHLASGANASYWVAKISGNRARDRRVTRALKQLGWRVVRVWESDVRADADRLARQISRLLAGS